MQILLVKHISLSKFILFRPNIFQINENSKHTMTTKNKCTVSVATKCIENFEKYCNHSKHSCTTEEAFVLSDVGRLELGLSTLKIQLALGMSGTVIGKALEKSVFSKAPTGSN